MFELPVTFYFRDSQRFVFSPVSVKVLLIQLHFGGRIFGFYRGFSDENFQIRIVRKRRAIAPSLTDVEMFATNNFSGDRLDRIENDSGKSSFLRFAKVTDSNYTAKRLVNFLLYIVDLRFCFNTHFLLVFLSNKMRQTNRQAFFPVNQFDPKGLLNFSCIQG